MTIMGLMKTTALTQNMVYGLKMVAADRAHAVPMGTLAALVRRGLIVSKTTYEKSRYAPRRTVSVSVDASLTPAGTAALAA